ncbi:restriction endonuclease subunit S [Zobellia uliginosa]|uniref:restriction endonuclease subunit S n=1 Tax=Zobellia uliginosa TaxID=143224 RepID=UPI0026E1E02F|nr:restriction endonuclease subunit S [Zobellia uliginosa]MDO6516573.1 restriction endonuclease subunit S [Zobellia uliginosa]
MKVISAHKEGYKETKLGLIPEEWKIAKLGELYHFKNGLNKGKEFFGYGTPIINYMDVFNNLALNKSNIKGKVSLNKNEIARFEAKKGDVFFTRTSETVNEIAFSSVLEDDIENCVFSGFVLRARPIGNQVDINFAKYCFSTPIARKEIVRKSTFTTRALTNGRFLSEVNLLLPPIPEQQKIAKILNTWDVAIKKQEELVAAKETLKKGLMQVLLTGKIRFKGFDGEWEEVRLGKIAEVDKNNLKSNTDPKYSFKYISLSDVVLGEINPNLRRYKFYEAPSRARRVVNINSVIMATVRPNLQAFAIIKDDARDLIASTGFAVIDCLEDIIPNFLIQYLFSRQITNQIQALIVGTNYPAINSADVKKLRIKLPSIKEQKKIASVLVYADKELKFLKQELIQLQDQKRALMQRLLTGEVRVKTKKL